MTNKREDILNKVSVWNQITKIGIGMLITSFIILPAGILACRFVFSETKDYYPFIIISLMILFFLCMISVGGYLTGKGITIASEIAKRKQELEIVKIKQEQELEIVKIKQEEKKKPESNMQEEKRQPEGKAMEIDLLKFNYKNLHEAVWNNHKAAWTVTGIFMPALFVVQGYMVKEYYKVIDFPIIRVVFVMEILMVIWLLIMRIFEHYNDVRRKRLKKIEEIFDKEISQGIGFKQYDLAYEEQWRIFKFSPMTLYLAFFWAYTSINMFLVGEKILQPSIGPLTLLIGVIQIIYYKIKKLS